jgi:hypothetical protein
MSPSAQAASTATQSTRTTARLLAGKAYMPVTNDKARRAKNDATKERQRAAKYEPEKLPPIPNVPKKQETFAKDHNSSVAMYSQPSSNTCTNFKATKSAAKANIDMTPSRPEATKANIDVTPSQPEDTFKATKSAAKANIDVTPSQPVIIRANTDVTPSQPEDTFKATKTAPKANIDVTPSQPAIIRANTEKWGKMSILNVHSV